MGGSNIEGMGLQGYEWEVVTQKVLEKDIFLKNKTFKAYKKKI